MITIRKPMAAVIAVLALSACEQQATDENAAADVALETPEQRLSYGVAYGLGVNMQRDGMNVDVAAFSAGLSRITVGHAGHPRVRCREAPDGRRDPGRNDGLPGTHHG